MTARTTVGQIDWPAAVRAVHNLNVTSQLGDLFWRERADEILLAEEVEEAGEPAVVVRAAEVLEPRRVLHVVGQPQPGVAAGTLGQVGPRWRRPGDVFANHTE